MLCEIISYYSDNGCDSIIIFNNKLSYSPTTHPHMTNVSAFLKAKEITKQA